MCHINAGQDLVATKSILTDSTAGQSSHEREMGCSIDDVEYNDEDECSI